MAIPIDKENDMESVTLSPSYRLPLLIILIGIPFFSIGIAISQKEFV